MGVVLFLAFLLGQHLAGELGLGHLEQKQLALGENLGELLEVLRLDLALLDTGVGQCRRGSLIVTVVRILLLLDLGGQGARVAVHLVDLTFHLLLEGHELLLLSLGQSHLLDDHLMLRLIHIGRKLGAAVVLCRQRRGQGQGKDQYRNYPFHSSSFTGFLISLPHC